MFYPMDAITADIKTLIDVRDMDEYEETVRRELRKRVKTAASTGSAYKIAIVRSTYVVKTYVIKRYRDTLTVERANFETYKRSACAAKYLCPTMWLDNFILVQPKLVMWDDKVGVPNPPSCSILVDSGYHNWGWWNDRPVYFDFGGHKRV